VREINKLRARLKNVANSVVEYKMPLVDAQNLLAEIDEITKSKPKEIYVEVPVEVPVETKEIGNRLDGGTFSDF